MNDVAPQRIGIYACDLKDDPLFPGWVRLGSFSFDSSTNKVTLTVYEESRRADLEELFIKVGLNRLNRRVSADEGPLFMEAVMERFSNTTYEKAVDETDKDALYEVFASLSLMAIQAAFLHDEAVAGGANPNLAGHFQDHVQKLARLRDQLHDYRLTPTDIERGATPRLPKD